MSRIFLALGSLLVLWSGQIWNYAVGNEIQDYSIGILLVGTATYLICFLVWWGTTINVLMPIGIVVTSYLILIYINQGLASKFAISVVLPTLGLFVTLALLRWIFKKRSGVIHIFERQAGIQ